MIKVKFLKVNNGDSIHLSYIENHKNINIVIDSGSRKDYTEEEKRPPRRLLSGEFKKLVDDLKVKNEIIDLLIITHVDNDHIGGLLKWLESSEFDKLMIGKIWFNSGELINEYFKTNYENDNRRKLDIFSSKKTSIKDGVTLEEKIKEHDIWDRKIIKSGDTLEASIYIEEELGAKFTILSPSEKELKILLNKWEEEASSSIKTSFPLNAKVSLKELMNDNKKYNDSSMQNGSSIAFILEIKDKSFLFLADCFHQTILDSIKRLGIDSLDVDLVKISHHGSQNNTNDDLLQSINTNKYVVSTDGLHHKHPNKLTFAKIIKNNLNAEIYLNYFNLKDEVFQKQDFKDFNNFSILDSKDLII